MDIYHDVFSLEEDERGETDMVYFEINTAIQLGDKLLNKQVARRMPYITGSCVRELAD